MISKLKELAERHHQECSLRLNLTQNGETHWIRILESFTDGELSLDSEDGGV